MTSPANHLGDKAPHAGWFSTTHWSVVLDAADSTAPGGQEALEQLCRTYWSPLYAYVRQRGYAPEDAQDLTQAFFARFLERKTVQLARRERGKFRSFLLTSLKHFLANEWERARAEKRGGGQTLISWDAPSVEERYPLEASPELTPDKVFERRWALTLFQSALARLREESVAEGKADHFETLKAFLTDQPAEGDYAAVAARLNMTPGAVPMAVHRLRKRYGQVVREEIAHTVASDAEVQDELRYLVTLVTG